VNGHLAPQLHETKTVLGHSEFSAQIFSHEKRAVAAWCKKRHGSVVVADDQEQKDLRRQFYRDPDEV
jgi:hypothetical protein